MHVCHYSWMNIMYGAKWHDNAKIYELKIIYMLFMHEDEIWIHVYMYHA